MIGQAVIRAARLGRLRLPKGQPLRHVCLAALALAAAPHAAAETCVENGTDARWFFAAEDRDGQRRTGWLDPAGTLCAGAPGAAGGGRGVVSAFPDAGHLEGCSRLVPGGGTETLLAYADFDRCRWSSHGIRD